MRVRGETMKTSAAEAEPLRNDRPDSGSIPERSTDPPWLLERSLFPSRGVFGEGAGRLL